MVRQLCSHTWQLFLLLDLFVKAQYDGFQNLFTLHIGDFWTLINFGEGIVSIV